MIVKRFTLFSAVHILLWQGGRLLMLRRCNTGYEDGNYSVIAGHLDGGEMVTAAAAREAREEVGIVIAPQDIRVATVMHRLSSEERIDFFVTVERWTGNVFNAEPDKCDDLRWCAPDALPNNTIPYVRRAIANVAQGMWFDSFGW